MRQLCILSFDSAAKGFLMGSLERMEPRMLVPLRSGFLKRFQSESLPGAPNEVVSDTPHFLVSLSKVVVVEGVCVCACARACARSHSSNVMSSNAT